MPAARILSKPKLRQRYLAALARSGSATDAAAMIGVERTTPYLWRKHVPGFAALCDQVRRDARIAGRRGMPLWSHPAMNDRRLMRALERLDIAEARAQRLTPTTVGERFSTVSTPDSTANALRIQEPGVSSTLSTNSTLSTDQARKIAEVEAVLDALIREQAADDIPGARACGTS
ncbi:MAG: hypothetical protein FJX02_10680 [Alphaproteobacteria bacterium]|nr:hypothetical protein [Alphaproteobacteria bacterium]